MNGIEDEQFEPQPGTPWKKIGLYAGIGLLILVVIGGAIYGILRLRQPEPIQQPSVRTQQETQQTLSACEDAVNPEACRRQRLADLARSTGDLSACDALENEEDYDNCAWGVAREQADPALCDAVNNESDRQQCKDHTYLLLAQNTNDAGTCENIQSARYRQSCESQLAGPITSENCMDRENDEAFCEDIALYEQALFEGDISLCEQIAVEDTQEGCEFDVNNLDRDEDGLTLRRERELGTSDTDWDSDDDGLSDWDEVETYGTDPLNPDTDGDGFNDFDEIASGFDPNGPGEL